MHSLIIISLLFASTVFFNGCSSRSPVVQIKGSEKLFENEDIYILNALYLEEQKDYKNSSNLFNILYKETDKKEYLYRSLRNDLVANEDARVVQRVDNIVGNKLEDFELIRIKIIALSKLDKLAEAKELATGLVKVSNDVDDYILVSEIYVKLKEYETAIKYLESAYIKDYNEKILERIALILYVNLQKQKDAIAQLETHSRINGCSEFICSKLIGFYSNENNIEGLLSTYLRLYKINFGKDIARKIVQIYGYKKNYPKMIEFLQESEIDNDLLLQLYIQVKDFKKATQIAKELYEDSGDVSYLGQSAVFEYESSKNKNDKAMQKSVIAKLQEVVEIKEDGMYLNYLGYLLIDHDIDVKKGIKYVKQALKIEPNSAYYLDSLAWGYYKLKKCIEAEKIMNKIAKMHGGNDEEVLKHIKAIKECTKNIRGENTK